MKSFKKIWLYLACFWIGFVATALIAPFLTPRKTFSSVFDPNAHYEVRDFKFVPLGDDKWLVDDKWVLKDVDGHWEVSTKEDGTRVIPAN